MHRWLSSVLVATFLVTMIGIAPDAGADELAGHGASASAVVSTDEQQSFADVTAGDDFALEVLWLANEGLDGGWTTTHGDVFRPDDPLTRQQLVDILDAWPDTTAADVLGDFEWFGTMQDAGTAVGSVWWTEKTAPRRSMLQLTRVPSGDRPVRRSELARALHAMAGRPDPTGSADFSDVPSRSAAFTAVAWATELGLAEGIVDSDASRFGARQPVARDEAAALLYRYSAIAEPEIPIEDGVVVAPEVQVLTEEALAGAVFTPELGTLQVPAGSRADLAANDVIIAGVTPETPHGLLARVTRVTLREDDTLELALVEATLRDAIVTTGGSITASGALESSEATALDPRVLLDDAPTAMRASNVRRTVADISVARLGFEWNTSFGVGPSVPEYDPSKPDEPISFTGEGALTYAIDTSYEVGSQITIDVSPFSLNEVSVALVTSDTTSTGLTGTVSGTMAVNKRLVEWDNVWTVWIGPVPVVIEGELGINAEFSLTGSVSFESSISSGTTSMVGFQYRDGSFSGIDDEETTDDEKEFAITGSADTRLALTVGGEIRFYGVAGAGVAGGPYVTWGVDASFTEPRAWSCPFTTGLTGEIYVVAGINFLGFSVGPQFKAGLERDRALSSTDPCAMTTPTPADPPAPVEITTSSIPDASAGEAYFTPLEATGGEGELRWRGYTFSTDFTVDEAGGIYGTSAQEGDHLMLVVAADSEGHYDSRLFAIHVGEAPSDPEDPEPLVLLTTSLDDGVIGRGYYAELEASGGVAPYVWTVEGLDAGLDVAAEGRITGSPVQTGTYEVTVAVEDAAGTRQSASMTFLVTPPPTPAKVEWISPYAAGTEEWNKFGTAQSIGQDTTGRHVIFWSNADNLVSPASSQSTNMYIRDTVTDETTLATRFEEPQAWVLGYNPAISDDGSIAVFASDARVVWPAIEGADYRTESPFWSDDDVLLRDLESGQWELVSASTSGEMANGRSQPVGMDASGRYVLFSSAATDLVSSPTTDSYVDLFLKDRMTGTVTQITVSSDGESLGANDGASISADGSTVVYTTYVEDTVYAYDVATGTTTALPIASTALAAWWRAIEISDDASTVAVFGDYVDADGVGHNSAVHVLDVASGAETVVRPGSDGASNPSTTVGAISAFDLSGDGQTVAVVELMAETSVAISNRSYRQRSVALYDTETGARQEIRNGTGDNSWRDLEEVKVNVDATRVTWTEQNWDYGRHIYQWSAKDSY